MQSITWFTPILPGKLEEWKAMVAEVNGPRREEMNRLYQKRRAWPGRSPA